MTKYRYHANRKKTSVDSLLGNIHVHGNLNTNISNYKVSWNYSLVLELQSPQYMYNTQTDISQKLTIVHNIQDISKHVNSSKTENKKISRFPSTFLL